MYDHPDVFVNIQAGLGLQTGVGKARGGAPVSHVLPDPVNSLEARRRELAAALHPHIHHPCFMLLLLLLCC
jgi:hypothetical protein